MSKAQTANRTPGTAAAGRAPFFTVVVPTFDRPALLQRALTSVLAQTFTDFEVVVVDDASPEPASAQLEDLNDRRVRIVRIDENRGNAGARNEGVRHARGEWIAFLDDDDEYASTFLERTREVIAAGGDKLGWTWCGTILLDDSQDGRELTRQLWQPSFEGLEEAYLGVLDERRIGTCGLAVHRSCFEEVGLFDESLRAAVDSDFLIRLAHSRPFAVVPEHLVKVHDHAGGRVRRNRQAQADAYRRIAHRNAVALDRAPAVGARFDYKVGWLHYHAGDRGTGRQFMLRSIRRRPLRLKSWLALLNFEVLGRFGPRLHESVASWRRARRGSLSRGIEALLARSPLEAFFRRRASRRLVVLAYHRVPDPQSFEQQMRELRERWYPIDLDALLDALQGGRPLPPRSVLVTFDDGDPSVVEEALPILTAHGIPAVVFPVAGMVGTDEPFWWQEVTERLSGGTRIEELPASGPDAVAALKEVPDENRRQLLTELRAADRDRPLHARQLTASDLARMRSAGVAIGNHTFDHPCLDRCTGVAVREQIEAAHRRLQELVGEAPRIFAYPNGNYDPRAAAVLEELGYAGAFLFDHRLSRVPPPRPMAISRVRVNAEADLDRFRLLISGLHPFLHHAIGRS